MIIEPTITFAKERLIVIHPKIIEGILISNISSGWMPVQNYYRSEDCSKYFCINHLAKQFKLDVMPDSTDTWLRFTYRKDQYQIEINKWGKDISESSSHYVTGKNKDNLVLWLRRSLRQDWQKQFGLWGEWK